ncbi:MAG: dephospho-CoA kinase [Flavobacteriales bacterium]|nr:dephospho-CoA kinase [Flavobacteriales bacterium]
MNTLLKENKKPLLVGLTGGIGSGKSTVAKIFQAYKIPVFNSDVIAKSIINTDIEVKNELIRLFGIEVYKDGKYNSRLVANEVFKYPSLLKQLNLIVHPKVGGEFEKWIELHQSKRILLKEAAILIESGSYQNLDKLILVIADKESRIKRVVKRDLISSEEIERRINNQMSDEEKKRYCNYFIYNNEKELLIPQIENIVKELSKV